MTYAWMLLALLLTVVGALLILHFDDRAREHEEEATFVLRTQEQQASLTVAKCAVDPVCAEEHANAQKRLAAHRLQTKKQEET